jgi:hypothetical protein
MTQGGHMNRNIKKIISLIFSFCFVIVSLQFVNASFNHADAYYPPDETQLTRFYDHLSNFVRINDIDDLSNDRRKYDISTIVATGIWDGCKILENSDTLFSVNFCPDKIVTRGQLATALKNLYDEYIATQYDGQYLGTYDIGDPDASKLPAPISDQGNAFKDISKLSVDQQKSINWLVNGKFTKGCNKKGDKFCPDSVVTRGALAEFFFRLVGRTNGYLDYTPNFKDIVNLGKERIRAINWMKNTGISVGCNKDGTKYCPNKPVNWGSMAQLLEGLRTMKGQFFIKDCPWRPDEVIPSYLRLHDIGCSNYGKKGCLEESKGN